MSVFSVNAIFFTVLGYPMSYIEFVGTVLNIVSVWLVIRKNIWTWPVGIIAVMLFAVLFYQIQLYSDCIEQLYFFVTGFYGWRVWIRPRADAGNTKKYLDISYSSGKTQLVTTSIIITGTIIMGFVMSRIHIYLPSLFPNPAAFPYLDAFTTVMSFAAQVLMAHKKMESWYLWICVDVIGIGLYYIRGVRFVSILYIIFLVLATNGLIVWRKGYRSKSKLTVSSC
jgi:nicotinamide mononucleotide transporter